MRAAPRSTCPTSVAEACVTTCSLGGARRSATSSARATGEITQERIDRFADATDDHQWIHVDPEPAADGPFGTTSRTGPDVLALVRFWHEVAPLARASTAMGINYGSNKVRFPSPVPVGSRVRGRFTVAGIEEIEGGVQ